MATIYDPVIYYTKMNDPKSEQGYYLEAAATCSVQFGSLSVDVRLTSTFANSIEELRNKFRMYLESVLLIEKDDDWEVCQWLQKVVSECKVTQLSKAQFFNSKATKRHNEEWSKRYELE